MKIQCADCGKTLTWFNYSNVWEEGKIKERICLQCKEKRAITKELKDGDLRRNEKQTL